MAGRIAVIGSCMVDLVTYVERMPAAGETIAAPRFEMGFGGKGANQAVAAAKLGSDVMMVACLGDDAFGHDTLRNFAATGVDTAHVRLVAGASSGVAPIFVEPSGENRILIVKGANESLSPADIDRAAEDLAACQLILLQLEVPLETVYHAIAWGRRHDVPVLLNPAPAVAGLETARIRDATFFVPNQTELAILTGLPTGTRMEAEVAARRVAEAGIACVIVTLGAEGALLVRGTDPSIHIPPVAVMPVDTTGAGDAFIGAFAHRWVEGGVLEESLGFAARYAADSITRRGTQKAFADRASFVM